MPSKDCGYDHSVSSERCESGEASITSISGTERCSLPAADRSPLFGMALITNAESYTLLRMTGVRLIESGSRACSISDADRVVVLEHRVSGRASGKNQLLLLRPSLDVLRLTKELLRPIA
jgi:hypothetical protein